MDENGRILEFLYHKNRGKYPMIIIDISSTTCFSSVRLRTSIFVPEKYTMHKYHNSNFLSLSFEKIN